MNFPGRMTSGALLLSLSCAALAQSELDVRVKPSNDALKANIEGYIGGLGDRDEDALLRFSRGAEEQARKAAQALGYYQPQIDSEVQVGKAPRLILTIDPGEPVHLRNVTIRIDGPAASSRLFACLTTRASSRARCSITAAMKTPSGRSRTRLRGMVFQWAIRQPGIARGPASRHRRYRTDL